MKQATTMLMLLAGVWPAPALAQANTKPAAAPQQSYPRLGDALARAGTFSTFLKLWNLAGPDRARSAKNAAAVPGQITIFAPTDAAFAAMGEKRVNALIADKAKLRSFLRAHIVERPLLASDMFDPVAQSRKTFRNAQGWVLGFSCNGRHAGMHNPVINGKARVGAFQDVRTSEGTVHGIDAVLVP